MKINLRINGDILSMPLGVVEKHYVLPYQRWI